jgi:MFS family permease
VIEYVVMSALMHSDKIPSQSKTNRIILALFLVQSLTSAAVISASTVTSILGAEVSGNEALAGVPSAVILFAGAPAAVVWGVLWDRTGRRWGLSLGVLTGLIGALIALLGIVLNNFSILLVGMVGLGFLSAATRLSRFIAAEINAPSQRGRAISYVVMGGTVGAIFGPLLVSPSGRLATSLGLPELAGVFIVPTFLYLVSILVSQWGLRPEPLVLSKAIDAQYQESDPSNGNARPLAELLRVPGVIVAVGSATLSQFVMVMIMGITALHIRHHGGSLGEISIVISAHTLGMFAFSIFTGRLADKWGRAQVIVSGALLLLASVVIAPLSAEVPVMVVALFLLGLGWNLCFVGGSALLSDHLTPAERSQTQGMNDLLINLVSGFGSLGGGVLFAAVGYGILTLSAGVFVLVTLGLASWWYWSTRRLRLADFKPDDLLSS